MVFRWFGLDVGVETALFLLVGYRQKPRGEDDLLANAYFQISLPLFVSSEAGAM